MAKRTALKGCFLLLFVIVVLVIGIVAWQVLSDDNSSRSSNDSSSSGGFFGSGGLFGDDDNNTTASPPSFTTRPRATPAPNSGLQTDAPTIAPTIAPYPFNQCSSDSAQCCNGVENICDFPVNEVMFGVVHNAMATTDSFLFPNHERPMEEALEAGFRGVNLDVCLCNGVSYKLCHGQCGIGEADPTTEFSKIVSFLNQNPNEVIILTIEVNNGVNLNDFYDQVLSQVDGFQDLLYVHNNATDPWPTMGTLIDNNTRLIAFHFNGPTCQNEGDCPQGLQFYFANVMEAEFQLDSIEAILDTETSCLVTRGAGSSGAFYAVNNFITTGTFGSSEPKEASRIANEYRSARDRIDECAVLGPKNVNLFYVDFWSYGDIVQVVQEYNMGLGTYQEQEE